MATKHCVFDTAEGGAQHRITSNTVNVLKGYCQITRTGKEKQLVALFSKTQYSQNLCRVLLENGIKGRYQRNPGTTKKEMSINEGESIKNPSQQKRKPTCF